MADLLEVLPDFDLRPYTHLLHSLEKCAFTVADLITLDPIEIARECPLPLSDVRRLVVAVVGALQKDVGISTRPQGTSSDMVGIVSSKTKSDMARMIEDSQDEPDMVKTLDPVLDEALGGGLHTGYITEIAGESSAGKTQFVLGLLASTQLPPPHGLSRSAMYISTEAPLNTKRLLQILETHPAFKSLGPSTRPTLDKVYCIPVNDVEAQEHIIEFQLPLAVKQYDIGLVVIDSVAANYRAEYETRTTEGLAERAWDLAKLGRTLRKIAVEDNVAVVVTNQVSDRFDEVASRFSQDMLRSPSPAISSSPAVQQSTQPQNAEAPAVAAYRNEVMSLDHQQRFFTGWGDGPVLHGESTKTPALGLAWTNQISARVVLKMEGGPSYPYSSGNIWSDRKRRRFLSVVFGPWVTPTSEPVEYEIKMEGVVSVKAEELKADPALLDESLWGFDGVDEDEEFP